MIMTYKFTGEIAEQITACTSFAEDPSLRSNNHIPQLTIACNSNSYLGQSNPSVLHRKHSVHIHAYTQRHIIVKKLKYVFDRQTGMLLTKMLWVGFTWVSLNSFCMLPTFFSFIQCACCTHTNSNILFLWLHIFNEITWLNFPSLTSIRAICSSLQGTQDTCISYIWKHESLHFLSWLSTNNLHWSARVRF